MPSTIYYTISPTSQATGGTLTAWTNSYAARCGTFTYSATVSPTTSAITFSGTSALSYSIGTHDTSLANTYTVTVTGKVISASNQVYLTETATFTIVLQPECLNPTITPATLTDINYSVRDSSNTVNLAAWTSNQAGCGAISYSVSISSSNTISPYPVTFTSGASVSVTVYSLQAQAVGTYTVRVAASQTY